MFKKSFFWKIYENVPFAAFHGGTERFNGKNSRCLGGVMEKIPAFWGKRRIDGKNSPFIGKNSLPLSWHESKIPLHGFLRKGIAWEAMLTAPLSWKNHPLRNAAL